MEGVQRCFPTLRKKQIELTKQQQETERERENVSNQLMIIYQMEGIVGI